MEADVSVGLDDAKIQKKKKKFGRNKVSISTDGMKEFPNFKHIPVVATALRDGRQKEVMAEDLVPGDIVFFRQGQRIPADARILEASPDLRMEMETIGFGPHMEGNLNGHSRSADEAQETVGVWEAKNLVFTGCRVEAGKGKGLVVKTGAYCIMGVIAREMEWHDTAQQGVGYSIPKGPLISQCCAHGLLRLDCVELNN